MKVRRGDQVIPTELVSLDVFGWDRADRSGEVCLTVDLDERDLLELGCRLVEHAERWEAEEPGYFEGQDMEGVPRPTSERLFVERPASLHDFLEYASFWHGPAGLELMRILRQRPAERPAFWLCHFVSVLATASGAQLLLGATEDRRVARTVGLQEVT